MEGPEEVADAASDALDYHYYEDGEGNKGYYDDAGNYYPLGDTTGYYSADGEYHLYEASQATSSDGDAATAEAEAPTAVVDGDGPPPLAPPPSADAGGGAQAPVAKPALAPKVTALDLLRNLKGATSASVPPAADTEAPPAAQSAAEESPPVEVLAAEEVAPVEAAAETPATSTEEEVTPVQAAAETPVTSAAKEVAPVEVAPETLATTPATPPVEPPEAAAAEATPPRPVSAAAMPAPEAVSESSQLLSLGPLQNGCLPSALGRLALHGTHGLAAVLHPTVAESQLAAAMADAPADALRIAPAFLVELVQATGVPCPGVSAQGRRVVARRARMVLFDGERFLGNTLCVGAIARAASPAAGVPSASTSAGASDASSSWTFDLRERSGRIGPNVGGVDMPSAAARRGRQPAAPILVRSRLRPEGLSLLVELTLAYECSDEEAARARNGFAAGVCVEEEVCAAFTAVRLPLVEDHTGATRLQGEGVRTLNLPLFTGSLDAPKAVAGAQGAGAASQQPGRHPTADAAGVPQLVIRLSAISTSKGAADAAQGASMGPQTALLPFDQRGRALVEALSAYTHAMASALGCVIAARRRLELPTRTRLLVCAHRACLNCAHWHIATSCCSAR